MEIDLATAARAFGTAYFNLLRRGADGSLVLSADRWRLVAIEDDVLRFAPRDPGGEPLVLARGAIERVTWDQLARQQVRSQIRFSLKSGDVWTFSGSVDRLALPD